MTGAISSRDDLPGRTLAHFRVIEEIGRGGMGTVYRAEDEKLRRFVALKVLASDIVSDEERRMRFLREARSAAALTHPNIAAVYEIGEEDGVVFIAMELVEGRSLREVLAQDRPLALARVRRIATGVARALARAHRAGVIHRDLKPDNVMIGDEDDVKLLDFGLAKIFASTSGAQSEDELAVQDTISHVSTREGRILGTPAYMSPEQGTGRSVDQRADIFSFGTMVYEMVAGRRPFSGETPMELIVSVSRDEPPPLRTVMPAVPPELDRIVGRCLEKDPDDRYSDAREVLADLEGLGADSLDVPAPEPEPVRSTGPPPTARVALAGLVLILLAVGLWAVAALFGVEPETEPDEVDTDVPTAAGPTVYSERRLTSMPAENRIVTATVRGDRLFYQDQEGIWVRELDGVTPRPLAVPEGGAALEDVYPSADRVLLGPRELLGPIRSQPVTGGAASELRANALTGRVSPDGRHIVFVDRHGIHAIRTDGDGEPELLSSRARGDAIAALTWSPSGAHVAFVRRRAAEDGANATLETVSMDGARLERVVEDRRLMQPEMAMAWPSEERMVYALAAEGPGTELWELALTEGAATSAPPQKVHDFPSQHVAELRVAEDGALTALLVRVQSDVYVADVVDDGRALADARRLTLDDGNDRPHGWLDTERVLFTSDRAGSWDVWSQRLGSVVAEPLVDGPAWESWPDVRADRVWTWQIAVQNGEATSARIVSVPAAGGEVEALVTVDVERAVALRGRPPPRAASFRCAGEGASALCVLGRSVAGELRFHRLGPGGEIEEPPFARLERPQAYYEWDLAPDGSAVALVKMGFEITIVPVDGSAVREVVLEVVGKLQYVSFAPGGDGFFLAAREWGGVKYALVHAALDGSSEVLASTDHAWLGQPSPSPDGARLAFARQEFDSDVWLLTPSRE